MGSGLVRIWIDGVAHETAYTSKGNREKQITRILIANATLKTTEITIDIIPKTTEKYVLQEYTRKGYDKDLQERIFNRESQRKRNTKKFANPGSKTKKGLCYICLGIAVFRISDNNNNYSLAI